MSIMRPQRRSANGSKEEEAFSQPIRSLTMRELEAMAQNAISVFIVKTSQRIGRTPKRARVAEALDAADA